MEQVKIMETKNQSKLIVYIIVIIIIGFVVYASLNKDETILETEKMENDSVLMDKDINQGVDEVMMPKEDELNEGGVMMDTGDAMMTSVGSYEEYSAEKVALKAKNGNVVLFFHASWCPTCRALDADIKANLDNIPADLTILDVDYDKYSELKKKYGITYQHTFVEVDKDGKLIKKWSGSPTLTALIAEVNK